MCGTGDVRKTGTSPSTVSRRDFIKGVIAGGVTLSSAGHLFRATAAFAQTGRAGDRLVTLDINGQKRHADVMRQETLAWTLRHKLGLTGTKLGCDRAECGSCTVLIDDVPHYACSVLTHTVRARKIRDGGGPGECRRYAAPDAAGCGGGTGLPVRLLHAGFHHGGGRFLEDESRSHRAELAQGVSGNLCRCQDYDKILTALMRGAENMRKASHG